MMANMTFYNIMIRILFGDAKRNRLKKVTKARYNLSVFIGHFCNSDTLDVKHLIGLGL